MRQVMNLKKKQKSSRLTIDYIILMKMINQKRVKLSILSHDTLSFQNNRYDELEISY